jgi:hypothetical protein
MPVEAAAEDDVDGGLLPAFPLLLGLGVFLLGEDLLAFSAIEVMM